MGGGLNREGGLISNFDSEGRGLLERGGLIELLRYTGLQSMAVSNEISGVQEQNIECASVQFYLSVHFKCAHKFEFVFVRNSNKKGNNCCENLPIQRPFCPVFRQELFGPKI